MGLLLLHGIRLLLGSEDLVTVRVRARVRVRVRVKATARARG